MSSKKKFIAACLLILHGIATLYPGTAYALTNGPSQPEVSEFKPASITNLVDPFSGDFNYNIPLLDVDGYPVNIAYSSGGSMDDEASWVGYGWSINPGSISRVMKGLPDDFNGSDKIKKEYNIRKDITGGVTFNTGLEVFGLDFLGANASCDIFYNNQRGLGVEIGAGISATLNTAKHVSGEYTAGLSAGGQLGIKSNSQTGAEFSFGAKFCTDLKHKESSLGALGFSYGGSLSSRAGLKSTTLGVSFNTSLKEAVIQQGLKVLNAYGSATTHYGQAFNPTIIMPLRNESYSISPQVGFELFGLQAPTFQVTGHYTKQQLAVSSKEFPAYGFLHNNKGKTDPNALLDINREKDVPYTDNTPTLAVPYITQDLFTATSHLGSSQFKAFSSGSGVFFDALAMNTSDALSLGVEFGAGVGVKGGGDFAANGSSTVTRKWIINNDFLPYGDFSKTDAPDAEEAYFKLVGEKSSINKEYYEKVAGKEPVKIKTDDVDDQAKAFSSLVSNNKSYPVTSKINRNRRESRGELFMPLTAANADKFGLDKKIKNYNVVSRASVFTCNSLSGSFNHIDRIGGSRKAHHLSEITVTKADGMRLVYGTPVYNNEQTDVTFSVNATAADTKNLVPYSSQENSQKNGSGKDFYFSKETVPAYATSFLLTGVCTPDYTDLTGNGISADDPGNAIKFNYSLVNPNYRWRTPNDRGRSDYATFNEGNKSDHKDNKASYSYGSKELWYAHSIESKNMVAVFRLGDRSDGYGYHSNGTLDVNSQQKKLERIDLYTKAELLNNTNPVPIKSVHFEYDYSLFPNVPNSTTTGAGKLTLKSVYFTYGLNNSGQENRYFFTYNASGDYQYQQYDRWGNYKDKSQNFSFAGINLDNNDYPYSVQDKTIADAAVQKWQLSEIELPSGGKIKVSYESDDYAFVQNRRAMQMAKIIGYGSLNNYGQQSYQQTDKIYVQLPGTSQTDNEARWKYFEGIEQLYFKTKLNLDNAGAGEMVSGYAKVNSVNFIGTGKNIAEITLEKRGSYHPVAAAGWQYMRLNRPELAFPYEVDENLGPLAFVMALIAAIRNIGELLSPFEEKAMRQGFCSQVIPDYGFVRIVNNFKKLGGGLRVKKILMDDAWPDMVGGGNGRRTTTGMEFQYTKKLVLPDGTTATISSGVASYEPMAGSEENPFKQPIVYQQKAHLTSNIYTVEEPLGESYFPAPTVGYSEVKIIALDAEGQPVINGYTLKRFYTAKDYPTIVKRTDLTKNQYNQSSIFGLFNIDNGNSVVLSQGFYVENNDMHGKPQSDETFDGAGKMIAGSYYHYKTSGTEQLTLDNNALTLQPDGTVKTEAIGQEFELFHDMREQVTDNTGVNINLNLDVLYFVLFVIPIPTCIPIVQSTYCGYQSASTIKVVNKYAINDKVTTIENGSTTINESMLWDPITGEVLMTKTINGYDDPIYQFQLPAYMANEYVTWINQTNKLVDYEEGMGAAYKNTGLSFPQTDISLGQVPSIMAPYLVPGDELGSLSDGSKAWVMEVPGGQKRIIDANGNLYNKAGGFVILRSGRRNLMGANTYSIVSLKNPIRNGKVDISQSTEILSTSATTFSDEWSADLLTSLQRCISVPFKQKVNPYNYGLKGNWREKVTYVYSTDRSPQLDGNNPAKLPTNIRKGGSFQEFSSFYDLENGKFVRRNEAMGPVGQWDRNWIASMTVTNVNQKGAELENRDALGRYSAAQFGFDGLVATAVAGNARQFEIAYDGFEDYQLLRSCQNIQWNMECSNTDGEFGFFRPLHRGDSPGNFELSDDAHTGNYSVRVAPGYQYAQTHLCGMTEDYADLDHYFFNSAGEMLLSPSGVIRSTRVIAGRKYLLSAWVKGDVASIDDPANPAKAKIIFGSGSNMTTYAVRSGPKVEGWVRVSAILNVPAEFGDGSCFTLQLFPGAQPAYFDDIRIHPYDANMKSFAYDYKTSRLMAELDENNYATFFEYNDEGQLLRNKKETEKGIITLRETRSRVRSCKPQVVINNPAAVTAPATVNLTGAGITSGSEPGLSFSYWQDADGTIQLSQPAAVAASGTYYIKANKPNGCYDLKPVKVVIQ